MPVINVKMLKATKEQKKEIIKKVTEAVSSVTKEPVEAFTVIIEEKSTDDFGIAGVQLSEMMK